MIKIVTIIGVRPQFIKAAVLSRLFAEDIDIEEIIVHTGQHFDKDMSDIFFSEMNIPKPKYNLNINSGSHGSMTGRMLEEIEKVLIIEKPNLLIVYGDTNSTLAGALAASKLNIKIAHIEAGLRSFNNTMPEEINRILTDKLSSLLFVPTQKAYDNLIKEGYEYSESKIYLSGDVMQDTAMFFEQHEKVKSSALLSSLPNKYILCTCHRAENTDNKDTLQNIVNQLNLLNNYFEVIIPLHPRTKQKIEEFGLKLNVTTINPVGYFDMIALISNSIMVITDSGGLQKEAYFFKKKCITIRNETEWTELVNKGFNKLVDINKVNLTSIVEEMLKVKNDFSINLYGNGTASSQIKKVIKSYLKNV